MKIGGIQKLSLIDYPGKPAAVIFTQGCNMICPYCHNPQLVYPEKFEEVFPEEEIFKFLEKRKKLLKGIVISGGEPTVQEDIIDFILKIKEYGYSIKLDTNGSNPDILKKLIDLKAIDFIAMDIKSSKEKYGKFYKGDISNIEKSIAIIKDSGLPHQFRTTYDEEILNDYDIRKIKEIVCDSDFVLQECIKQNI